MILLYVWLLACWSMAMVMLIAKAARLVDSPETYETSMLLETAGATGSMFNSVTNPLMVLILLRNVRRACKDTYLDPWLAKVAPLWPCEDSKKERRQSLREAEPSHA